MLISAAAMVLAAVFIAAPILRVDTDDGEVDYNVHARDYHRVMKLLKYGAIAAVIAAFTV